MKNRRTPLIVALSLLAFLMLAYFIYTDDERYYQWFESYQVSSEQPYGTLFIRKMLESQRTAAHFRMNDRTPLRKLLKDADPGTTDYVLIGQAIFLDEESIRALAHFIDAGGSALIATRTPPTALLDAAYVRECNTDLNYEQHVTTSVDLNFYHASLRREQGYRYTFRFGDTDFDYPWNYISTDVFCDSTRRVVPLGYQDKDHVNFVRIRIGKGNLYLHSNPLVFTNYFIAKEENLGYPAAVFSHLKGKDMVWDEYSKLMSSGDSASSPLYYILGQPSLKYAWWMLLVTVALYVAFAARRRQRAIPVLEAKTNTSLEFVGLISRLHYKNGNHVDMARKKMKYFLYFVRSKYGIHAENFREEHIRMLAEKSRVDVADVRSIFSQYHLIEEKFADYIEPNRLVDLHEAIENFYRQANKDHRQNGRNNN